ncbi:MAG: hypothetical protein U9P00_13215 [Pseudomonadota bacterium]|nr:hypothetical protein [Pseudomonadota bacterium]
MCYAYTLKKRALKETASTRKQFNAWIIEAKNALIANKPKHPDPSHEASSSVRERLAG